MSAIESDWSEIKAKSRRDAFHPVVQDYSARRVNLITSIISGKSCLELGAGDGFFSRELSQHFELTASDTSTSMLAKNPAARKEIIDSRKISIQDNSYDVVFEANMLHHLEDDRSVAREMVRVSRNFIVVIEPNRWHPLTILLGLWKKDERKSLLFTRKYISGLFSGLPVELISGSSFGLIPANKCPMIIWKILRHIDGRIPFFGLENILIFRKINE